MRYNVSVTPEELIARAERLEAQLDAAVAAGDKGKALSLLRQADLWRDLARELTAKAQPRTFIGNMAQPQVEPPRRRGRPTVSKHPFPRAVGNVAAWARKHGLERETVKSWFAVGDAGRPIPARWAKLIEREHGVPATPRTWPNGIRD